MNVVVDTSVWSLALRRGPPHGSAVETELAELIREGRVLLLGPVRQELLSGIRTLDQYRALRRRLRAFPDIALEVADYEVAASYFNRCRARGVQGSNTDFLICAASLRRKAAILTTDGDFVHYARVLRLRLHEPRQRPPHEPRGGS